MYKFLLRGPWGPLAALILIVALVGAIALPATAAPTPGSASPAAPMASPSPAAIAAPSPAATPGTAPGTAPATSTGPAPAVEQNRTAAAIAALAKAQALLEFFYMNSGTYPETLEDMTAQFNQGLRQNDRMVSIPTDPASGRKLIYTPDADHATYVVKVPDASMYNLPFLELHNIDWAFMNTMAVNQKRQHMLFYCGRFQEMIAVGVNQYNKENRNKFPEKLENLIPKYMTRLPVCPVCHKPFTYKFDERGFEIGCPDPTCHGLEIFRFSSTEGMKKYP